VECRSTIWGIAGYTLPALFFPVTPYHIGLPPFYAGAKVSVKLNYIKINTRSSVLNFSSDCDEIWYRDRLDLGEEDRVTFCREKR